jgi:FAD/FMN-containing dehydrogenase/Fe-S oxidoreductase
MAATMLPSPMLRRDALDRESLRLALTERVRGEVRFDAGTRAAYSTDASNYRQVPIAVVLPLDPDDAAEAVRVCAEHDAPIMSRGGGTSLAGECTNEAVVLDWSKYCHAVESIDPAARTAIVQPGVVLDELDRAAGGYGLMFGPRPATHGHCTLGGMIGNNSCGASAQAFGKTVDNVVRLEVLTYDGDRAWVGGDETLLRLARRPGRLGEAAAGLRDLGREYRDEIRARFPDIPRRVSGYNLDELLPGRGGDLARFLVGSESTLVTVLRAEVRLVPVVPHRTTAVFGFPSLPEAADAAPLAAQHAPLQVEGIDDALVAAERAKGMDADGIRLLPDGAAWLVVVMGDEDAGRLADRVDDLVAAMAGLDRPPSSRVLDARKAEALSRLREDALGAASWIPGAPATWPGWEDAAVPPERLGDYLRDFGALLHEAGLGDAVMYGHFGHGCVHCRIPFELTTARGISEYRRFIRRAAQLVAQYGGSLSGEHGDGQARADLLPIMFGDRIVEAFVRVKGLFDPGDRMNPGKVAAASGTPSSATDHLRLGVGFREPATPHQGFAFHRDEGSMAHAVLRCVGVGKCRDHRGGVMCPSYRATGEEEHSTRGRARLLFELMNGAAKGGPVHGWRSREVRDALDLCLSCKGCKSDCPVDVNMATYKPEFLHQHYRYRLRPAGHYSMGWLPLWARIAHPFARIANRLAHAPRLARLGARLAGVEPDRPLPYLAPERLTDWYRRRGPRGDGVRGEVLLWPDTFTDNLHPAVGRAAIEVLEDAGYTVVLPPGHLCCGLTWISTGQLGVARRVLGRTARALAPWLRRGIPVVGLEPSCTAVLTSDGPELLDDEDVRLLARSTVTFAQLLDRSDGWQPPHVGGTAVVQPHCHQHAELGFEAEAGLMRRAGIDAQTVGGCCGLAGNFGFEAGHLDVSVACAETELLPAVRRAGDDALVLADGFSCRTQLEQSGAGPRGVHLAEVLAAALRGQHPDGAWEGRVERPGPAQAIPLQRRGVQPFVARAREAAGGP